MNLDFTGKIPEVPMPQQKQHMHRESLCCWGSPLEGRRAERIIFGEQRRVPSLGEFCLAAKQGGESLHHWAASYTAETLEPVH